MRIVILTSSRKGTAAYCLPLLLSKTNVIVAGVILNQNRPKKKWSFYKKKIRKIMRIGIFGAINGIRIRKWYQQDKMSEMQLQDIEVICKQNDIPFATTPVLNSKQTIELMKEYNPDLGLSLGNSYISSKIFVIPAYGMLNIHGEVLPDFQNAQSVIWQLYEGRTETGYTIHKIDKSIDTGDILRQEKFPIAFKASLAETVSFNCRTILEKSAEGLVAVLNDFEQHLNNARPQGKGRTYTTPSFRQFLRIKKRFNKLKAAAGQSN